MKRKPKPSADTPALTTTSPSTTLKRQAPNEDVAIAALMTKPKKGILWNGQASTKRPYRRITFADMRDLPLVTIKEIERIGSSEHIRNKINSLTCPNVSVHHSSSHDFRNFDKNEGSAFCREPSPDDTDWLLLRSQRSKPLRTELSETGKREERRIQELGLMQGAMFG